MVKRWFSFMLKILILYDNLQGLKLTFQSTCKVLLVRFFHSQTGETTRKFFPNVWETWMILTRKHLLVDTFLTRSLSKSLTFCEFADVNHKG